MFVSRNGIAPRVDPSARVAPTASIVGDVTVGAGCYIDYGVVIASSGPPVVLGEGVSVLANAVMRSVGGHGRPAFPVGIGDECIIAPQVALAGCLDHSSRVGLHGTAAPDGEHGVLVTTDIEAARDAIARADFFGRAFALVEPDQEQLHREAAARLREEATGWTDEPVVAPEI